jgi:2-keto-4-pentenoate hydratase/2-oxohepta-3-ene-1,7-dioic acid hydratase in catechol pathway
MRIISFLQGGAKSIGVELNKAEVLDLHHANSFLPDNLRSLLELGDHGMELVAELMERPPRGAILASRDLLVCAPISRIERPKVLCVGLNYADHAAESGQKIPENPLVFAKYANTLRSPGENIVCPPNSSKLDYEAELVVVLGKTAKNVPEGDAYDYVAGYMCGNDVSEREFQRKDGQWVRAKSCDSFAPIGPALVTRDEIPDPHILGIGCKVNGESRQHSNTSQIHFKVHQLVSFISSYITLDPGDLIFTGTPPGVGFAMNPPGYLNAGDEVEVWIEKIGSIKNKVVSDR